jgi:hypothetical protein
MGMYTELHLNAKMKRDVPDDVVAILKHMVADSAEYVERPAELPDHPLFARTSRWGYMLRCNSYYFAADTRSTLRHDRISDAYYLCIQTNLKNYDSEIEYFLDWVHPYFDMEAGEFLGFRRYEESNRPTLVYMPGNPDAEDWPYGKTSEGPQIVPQELRHQWEPRS